MTRNRHLSVVILAWVYIAVGAAGFFAHLSSFEAKTAFRFDGVWIELVELLAVLAGTFLLLRHNWARWLALTWMVSHVVLSAFDAFRGFAAHCLFCAVIGWILFRPAASDYFRSAGARA